MNRGEEIGLTDAYLMLLEKGFVYRGEAYSLTSVAFATICDDSTTLTKVSDISYSIVENPEYFVLVFGCTVEDNNGLTTISTNGIEVLLIDSDRKDDIEKVKSRLKSGTDINKQEG